MRSLFGALEERYAHPGCGHLWERLNARASVQDPDGWQHIFGLVTGPVILLVHDSQGQCAFRLQSPAELQNVIEETSNFEFYVTNDELSYLLGFNHHDFLIGAGEAEAGVRVLRHVPN